jgi:hypothetical protein
VPRTFKPQFEYHKAIYDECRVCEGDLTYTGGVLVRFSTDLAGAFCGTCIERLADVLAGGQQTKVRARTRIPSKTRMAIEFPESNAVWDHMTRRALNPYAASDLTPQLLPELQRMLELTFQQYRADTRDEVWAEIDPVAYEEQRVVVNYGRVKITGSLSR